VETKRFTRVVEHFTCEHCGAANDGNGYTNHCHQCLWSKHVDINPGDRAATCGGLMKPTAIENTSGEYVLTHTCERCKHQKRNKVAANDNFDTVVSLAVSLADDYATGSVTRAPLGAAQQMTQTMQPAM
jgi:hypothetical protein